MTIRWHLFAVLLTTPLVASAQGPLQRGSAPPAADRPTLTPSFQAPYRPIASRQRLEWFAVGSVGPQTLVAGVFSAGLGTARNRPIEYGGTWEGFGKRYGMRLTGVASGNAIEAGIGYLWGEDPRYFRANGQPIGARIKNIVIMTFAARRSRDGHLAAAYARYAAIPGNNFLSNTWRANSESTMDAALVRTGIGFAGRMASNAFQEFWPDIRHVVLRRK